MPPKDTIELPINHGYVVLIDAEDLPLVDVGAWQPSFVGVNIYARRQFTVATMTRKWVLMHRLIMGMTDPSIRVDHKNRNGLDNRKCNLRIATRSQNCANTKKFRTNSSGYRGVTRNKPLKCWRVSITVDSRKYFLGNFDDPVDAALAYDAAARRAHGEFATLNFPDFHGELPPERHKNNAGRRKVVEQPF